MFPDVTKNPVFTLESRQIEEIAARSPKEVKEPFYVFHTKTKTKETSKRKPKEQKEPFSVFNSISIPKHEKSKTQIKGSPTKARGHSGRHKEPVFGRKRPKEARPHKTKKAVKTRKRLRGQSQVVTACSAPSLEQCVDSCTALEDIYVYSGCVVQCSEVCGD